MYGPENVIWIKNILRDGGNDWAYKDKICGTDFLLNWPSSKRGSAKTPSIGDIIVLFQRPKIILGKKNSKVHLTHLVTPVSDKVIDNPQYPKHRWCREVKLIAIANPISAIPNPGYFNFFKPNRGLTNPIMNLTNNIGLSEAETQLDIWSLFARYFCENVIEDIYIPNAPEGEYGELEGDKIVRKHLRQESLKRNSKIVAIAKAAALKNGKGHITCECCGFDFASKYGKHANNYIECHHKIHLNLGERITRITDLAMVCSNCHRMLHKRIDPKLDNIYNYYSVTGLSELIRELNY